MYVAYTFIMTSIVMFREVALLFVGSAVPVNVELVSAVFVAEPIKAHVYWFASFHLYCV